MEAGVPMPWDTVEKRFPLIQNPTLFKRENYTYSIEQHLSILKKDGKQTLKNLKPKQTAIGCNTLNTNP